MADTNPYTAGVFYSGEFVTDEFVETFSEIGVDRRTAVLATIAARPQVSQLIMNYAPATIPSPTNLSATYRYYHVTSGGVLTSTILPVQFADKTDHYLNTSPAPTHLIFTDTSLAYRYVTTSSTGAISASATAPATLSPSTGQFVGEYLEFIGADGYKIYRMKVNTSNGITCTLDREEPERIAAIRISQGHPEPYDGVNLWIEGLVEMGDINLAMDTMEAGYGGVSVARFSNLSIQVADREFEFLANQSWDSRDVEVRMGLTTESMQFYPVVLRGKTERAECNLNNLSITLRDQNILLDKAIQTHSYDGSNTLYNGNADLKGVLKPLLFGFCRHLTPHLIDNIKWIYQVHDGPMHEIFSIHTGGILLNNLGNRTRLDLWIPTTAEINAGGYRTDLASGCFRLAAPPEKPLTVVARGATGLPLGEPRIGHIIQYVVQRYLPEVAVETNLFNTYIGEQRGTSGIYIDEDMDIREVISTLCKPVGASVFMSARNTMGVKQVKTREPVAFLGDHNIVQGQMPVRRQPPRPGNIYRIGHGKSWTVFTDSDFLLGPGSVLVNTFLKNEWRYVPITMAGEGMTRLPVYASGATITYETMLDSPVQAGEVATLIAHRDHSLQSLYQLQVIGFSFKIEIGDTVLFQYVDGLGNQNVKTGIVVEATDKAPTSVNEDLTDLLIWA